MAQTVIGIFERNNQAQDAIGRLVQQNFSRESIDVALPDAGDSRGDVTDDYIMGTRLGRFFREIFADNEIARKYTSVAQRGVTVAVHTDDMRDAETAATILDEFGAIDVEERSRILEDSMTREDRKYNLQEGRSEPNAVSPDTARENPSRTEPTESRTISRDSAQSSNLTVNTRIIDRPIGGNWRLREEQVWIERTPEEPQHPYVDESGNLHKDE